MNQLIFEELNGFPKEEGQFLYCSSNMPSPLSMELIYVYWRNPVNYGGLDFDGYWAFKNDQNVAKMKGTWYRLKS